jgi:hypothetical protein
MTLAVTRPNLNRDKKAVLGSSVMSSGEPWAKQNPTTRKNLSSSRVNSQIPKSCSRRKTKRCKQNMENSRSRGDNRSANKLPLRLGGGCLEIQFYAPLNLDHEPQTERLQKHCLITFSYLKHMSGTINPRSLQLHRYGGLGKARSWFQPLTCILPDRPAFNDAHVAAQLSSH